LTSGLSTILDHAVPLQAKARTRQTLDAVFMLPPSYTGLFWLGVGIHAAADDLVHSMISWLFIQLDCPTNGMPHVTKMSPTCTAVGPSLKILYTQH